MTHQKPLLHQTAEGRLRRVRACFVLAHHVTGSDPAVGLHVILEGRQPRDLTFKKLCGNIPLSWIEQRKQFGFSQHRPATQ
jgi:hypothetical protein